MPTSKGHGKGRRIPTPRYLAESCGSAVLGLFRGSLRFLWRLTTVTAVFVLAFGTVAVAFGGYFYLSTMGQVPVLENPEGVRLPQDSTVYDRNGKLIGVISSQRRYIVSDREMGENIKNAAVAIEDERFFDHEGVDLVGMLRALKVDYDAWRSGQDAKQQGASTITQQYVKTVWLSNEQSLQRKFKEIALAVQLEARLSKKDILDRYLNTVYFGNGNYGAEAAARYYFGKSVADVNPYEAAILIATVNNPTVYDPTTEKGQVNVARRAALVLDKMYQLGYIDSAADVQAYKQVPVADMLHVQETQRDIRSHYYYDYVTAELFARYGKEAVLSGGWQVYTTLDLGREALMRKTARSVITKKGLSVAMAELDPRTGAVVAFLGGWDYDKSNFNLATQGHRQPGSSFKPFVYATAFKQGYRNDSPFSNAPLSLKDGKGKVWKVKPDSSARTMEQGLAYSDNAMAVRTILKTGVDPVIATARDLGIVSELNRDPAIALGGLTYGVTPLEMANAYGSFANGGTHYDPWCIDRITDKMGNTVFQHSVEGTEAVNTEIAAMMNKALQGVVRYGTAGGSIRLGGRPVAGKTGTTDNHADTWFVGYTPQFVTAVWLGYPDSNKPIPAINGQKAWGGTFTARIWNSYAQDALRGQPVRKFAAPKGLVEVPDRNELSMAGDMEAGLRRLGLVPVPREVSSDELPGTVLEVSHGGELVPLGSRVSYSVAVRRYRVPDFTGMSPYTAIQRYGSTFSLRFAVTFDDTAGRDGEVRGQDLAAGSMRDRGSVVTLSVRLKTPPPKTVTQQVKVPYIPSTAEYAKLQQQYQQALDSLAAAQAEADSLTQENGQLRKRFIPAVPDLSGLDATLAQKLLAGMGYSVKVQGSGSTVTGQSPAAGSVPDKATVTLTLGGTVP